MRPRVGPSPTGEPERGPLVGTSSPWTMRAAAICSWILSVGFGLHCLYAMWYFARRGEVWTFLGFPTYGRGPFEDVGIATSTPLLACFLVVCVAEFEVGLLLWQRRDWGRRLGLVLLPFEVAFPKRHHGQAAPAKPRDDVAR